MPFKMQRTGPRPLVTTLPAGFQLRLAAEDTEVPGTVLAIDDDNGRVIVETLNVRNEHAPLDAGTRVESIRVTAAALRRVFGQVGGGAVATRVVRLEFADVVRQSANENELDAAVGELLTRIRVRPGTRYFVVRECWSATGVALLGEQAELPALQEFLGMDDTRWAAPADTARAPGAFAIEQRFAQRLGVLVLLEEIALVSAGLGAGARPTLGRVPVSGPLSAGAADFAVTRVLFATDRNLSGDVSPGRMFGSERSELSYGACQVSIPRDHRMGHLETPSLWKLQIQSDPKKHVTLMAVEQVSREQLLAEIVSRVADSHSRSALLFVHGYNVTFEDAARRTAQIAYDLAFDGVPMFFAWPSQGTLPGYTIDEQMSEWSEPHVRAVLTDVLERPQLEKLYLIAHSMGNRAVTRVVGALLKERPELQPRLKEIILAAPDIDAEVFARDIAPLMTRANCAITLYASSEDKALQASKVVHKGRRAGDSIGGVVPIHGIETIDASRVDTGLVGHGYFAERVSVISDMFNLIRNGQRPDNRFGLQSFDTPAGRYWSFKP
jgi:esterase/lipase superfamily enzyme